MCVLPLSCDAFHVCPSSSRSYVQACSNSVLAHMVHVSLGSWCVALLTFGCVFGVTKGLYSLDQQKYDESWRHDFW